MKRVLETEVMDTEQEAIDYDAMDHSNVNQLFVTDLLTAGFTGGDVLDVGTGTAQIPIELCKAIDDCRVMAIDMATHMLDLGRYNIEAAGLIERITLAQVRVTGRNTQGVIVWQAKDSDDHVASIACFQETVRPDEEADETDGHQGTNGKARSNGSNGRSQNGDSNGDISEK